MSQGSFTGLFWYAYLRVGEADSERSICASQALAQRTTSGSRSGSLASCSWMSTRVSSPASSTVLYTPFRSGVEWREHCTAKLSVDLFEVGHGALGPGRDCVTLCLRHGRACGDPCSERPLPGVSREPAHGGGRIRACQAMPVALQCQMYDSLLPTCPFP